MSELKLFLLGSPRFERGDMPARLRRRKAIALAAYLAVTGETHSREALATLLWPNYEAGRGRTYLRRELAAIKEALGDGWLDVDRNQVGINARAKQWLDVAYFRRITKVASKQDDVTDSIQLVEAVSLYRADFLAGFTLSDAPEFDEWQFFQTESLRRRLGQTLEQLIDNLCQQDNQRQAIPHARRWLALDSLHEPAHRLLMQLYQQTGQQAAALRQYESCVQILDEELGVPPEPVTTALYDAIKAQRFTAAEHAETAVSPQIIVPSANPKSNPSHLSDGAQVSQPTHAHNLPLQPTPFIGREAELEELEAHLADPKVRLLTIMGPGGIGKTRLAIEAARQQVEAFGDGVYFVSLAQISPANFQEQLEPLVAALADVLHLTFHGRESPQEQLLTFVRDRVMLLVLDNFEHLLSQATIVADLLQSAPRIKILVTSRERLNLREEWLFPLKGMTVPETNILPSATSLRLYSAVQLFAQTARQIQPEFALDKEAESVIRICHLLHGMPLGIELAAAWVRLLSCGTIAEEIEKNVDFLSTTARNAPERHRSLRAVFEHSWQLLAESEQKALRRLSIFQGGFQGEAAFAVADAPLPLLASLADKSLIQTVGPDRYSIHELLRQFAIEKLQTVGGEVEAIRQKHCDYYCAFLQQQESRLKGSEIQQAQKAITRDLDNMRSAWQWAVAKNMQADIDRSLCTLWLYYDIRGGFLEGAKIFGQAVAQLRAYCAQDTQQPKNETQSCRLLGRALMQQGWFQTRLGLLSQARPNLQEGIALLTSVEVEARWDLALGLYILGCHLYLAGDSANATRHMTKSLMMFDEMGDHWGSGLTLVSLSQTLLHKGDYAEAKKRSEEAITKLSMGREKRMSIFALNTRGRVAIAEGDYARARRLQERCLKLYQELDDQTGMTFALKDLGNVACLQGAYPEAEEWFQQSIQLAQKTGHTGVIAMAHWGLGKIAYRQQLYSKAVECFRLSQDLYAGSGAVRLPLSSIDDGWADLSLGNMQAAEKAFLSGLSSALQTRAVPLALDALTGLAHLMIKQDEIAWAFALLLLTSTHAACDYETKQRAAHRLRELQDSVPPAVILDSHTRSQQLDWQSVAVEMVAGFTE